ncbi:MAG: alpha/beta hydrolase [Cyanobacteria bacterium P01_H01_bin.121]
MQPLGRRNSPLKAISTSQRRLTHGQLFWREAGTGPVVIFLHGSWQDGEQWQPALAELSNTFHCLAPDLLGFGASDHPTLAYSIQVEVECLAEWLQSLRIETVHLVGHSLGAWVAATYAIRFPAQVKTLVLVDPEGLQATNGPLADGLDPWLAPRYSLVASLLNGLRPLAKLLRQHAALDRLLQRRSLLRRYPTACRLLFGRRLQAIRAELLTTRINQVACPVLALHSPQATVRVRTLSQLYAHQSMLGTLQPLTQPLQGIATAELVAAIRDFLNQTPCGYGSD